MRPREERRRVVLASRLRCGAQWRHAKILNLSTRGIGLTSIDPPDRGAYIEIRRGTQSLVARVIWVNGLRFGACTQDAVALDLLLHQPDSRVAPTALQSDSAPRTERRTTNRSVTFKLDQSRAYGRALEFGFGVMLAASAAFLCVSMLMEVAQQPLEQIKNGLLN